eukprot:CAMPEP_0197079784 /NCGR_PEP_ID=MMETSP1384-20130603/213802_1 /TAXON_ID=29189 /ORGANISM="Ammonia sp." /LENGTH=746 /DNA_ID=CAMNT_0042518663 /DNA_START=24 /DNA_END=2264 /DNA_ORIENTATION=+
MLAKGNDQLMAKIHQIGNRLADPYERSDKIQQRKQARLEKKIRKKYQQQQQLIAFWSKKFVQHINVNNIFDEEQRKEDEALQHIEGKLVKFGVDTDELFRNRKPPPIDPDSIDMEKMAQIANDPNIKSEEDDEEQLENLQNMPDYVIVDEPNDDNDDAEDNDKHHRDDKDAAHEFDEPNDDNDDAEDNDKHHRDDKDAAHEFVKVDVEKYNFKPSQHKYPGLTDVKPPSSLPEYKPIKQPTKTQPHSDHDQTTTPSNSNGQKQTDTKMPSSSSSSNYPGFHTMRPTSHLSTYQPMDASAMKKDANDHEQAQPVPTNYGNLRYDGSSSQNTVYPSMKLDKPKTFTKYKPMDPRNMKPANDNQPRQNMQTTEDNDDDDDLLDELDDIDGTQDVNVQDAQNQAEQSKYDNLKYAGPPIQNKQAEPQSNTHYYPTPMNLEPLPKFTKYTPMQPKKINKADPSNDRLQAKRTDNDDNNKLMKKAMDEDDDEDDLLDDLDGVEVPINMYNDSNQSATRQQTQTQPERQPPSKALPQKPSKSVPPQKPNASNQQMPQIQQPQTHPIAPNVGGFPPAIPRQYAPQPYPQQYMPPRQPVYQQQPYPYPHPPPQAQVYQPAYPYPPPNQQYAPSQLHPQPQPQYSGPVNYKRQQTQMYNSSNTAPKPQQSGNSQNDGGNYPNIYRSKSMDAAQAAGSNSKYPNINTTNANKASGGYPNIYTMPKPMKKNHELRQDTNGSNANEADESEQDEELNDV